MTQFIGAPSTGWGAVVDMQHADGSLPVDHEQGRDAVLVKQCERLVDQRIRTDRLGVRRHEDRGRMIQALLYMPPQIAVGYHSDEMTFVIGYADHAEALGAHFDDGVMHAGVLADQRHLRAAVHQPADSLEPRTERAAGMEPAEI